MALTNPVCIVPSIKTPDGSPIVLPPDAFGVIADLVQPSFIHIAKNTSVVASEDFNATRIYQLAKSKQAAITFNTGSQIKDPSTLSVDSLEVQPIQFAPSQIAAKIGVKQMDLLSPNLKDALGKSLGNWMAKQRQFLEYAILNGLASSSQNVQTNIISKSDVGATTLEKGAHFEKRAINNFDDARAALFAAIRSFKKIGLPSAQTSYDKGNYFVSGVNSKDILCICSFEFLNLITSSPQLLTSNEGYSEIFKQMSLRQVFGINLMPCDNLPAGIHFLLIMTGQYGSFCYETSSTGLDIIVKDDPTWPKHLIAFIDYIYIAGIVNESLIFGCVETDYQPQSKSLLPFQLSGVLGKNAQSEIQSMGAVTTYNRATEKSLSEEETQELQKNRGIKKFK